MRTKCLLALALALACSGVASGQIPGGRTVPREGYFLAFSPFQQGEYRDALRSFRSAASQGVNTGAGRWVDSICYYTMIGECLYHAGDLGGALEQYDAALQLLIARRGWLERVQFPPAMPPVLNVPALPWGPSQRQTAPGAFPETLQSLQGTDPNVVLRQGGVVAAPELYPVRVIEIMRCVGLATRRRREILGPLAEYTSLTDQVVKELTTRQVPANHWSQTLMNVQLGIAKAAAGDRAGAKTLLQNSLTVAGGMDHPLTALALIELGHLALEDGELDAAQNFFFEATFPAAYYVIQGARYPQAGMFEEAMLGAAQVYALKGGADVFPPLITATDWAFRGNLDRAAAAFSLTAAEQAAAHGQASQAVAFLTQARRAMGRSDLPATRLGAMLQFHEAALAYSTGDQRAGDAKLGDSLPLLAKSSPRLFRLAKANELYVGKQVSPRVAGTLFRDLLREPTDSDWRLRTADTLMFEVTPHEPLLERWLEISLGERDVESLVLVSEQLRRHKFFQQTQLGGRLLALRWILEAPDAVLGVETQQQRQQLWAEFPDLRTRSGQINKLLATLHDLPVDPSEADDTAVYERTVKELATVVEEQELALRKVALRPFATTRMMPPLLGLDEIQSRLQQGQAILLLVSGVRSTHAMLITADKQYRRWQIKSAAKVRATLVDLMREIGNVDASQAIIAERLANDAWKPMAAEIYQAFAEELTPDLLAGIDELVIVPDDFFWYLPFEMLQVPDGDETKSLIELVKIRYAPTLGLAVPDARPRATAGPRIIVHGRILSRDTQPITTDAATQLRDQHPQSVLVRRRLPATSQFLSPLWNQLVVLDDVELNDRQPLVWSPAQFDQGRPGGGLLDWLSLPFGSPTVVVLPGFRTQAENGLRGRGHGDEIFLSTCALMASGTRTALLSRWRTGGRTSMEMIREFLQELPQESPATSWQRSVLLSRSAELDVASEPRLKELQAGEVPSSDHPFFWAGFMLVGDQ